MRTGQLLINSISIIPDLLVYDSFFRRGIGLIGCSRLKEGAGVWLIPCRGVHTCFMGFSLDLIYLDAQMMILGLDQQVRPFRFPSAPAGARSVIEVASGWLQAGGCEPGKVAEFIQA